MVGERSVKRKAPGAQGVPTKGTEKKVRVAAPVKKVLKTPEPEVQAVQATKAKAEPKSKPAPVKGVLPVTAIKKAKDSGGGSVKKSKAAAAAPVKSVSKATPSKEAKPVKSGLKATTAAKPVKAETVPKAEAKATKAVKKAPKAEAKAPEAPKAAAKPVKAKPQTVKESKPSKGAQPAPLKSALAKPGAKKAKTLRIHEMPASDAVALDAPEGEEDDEEDAHLEGFSDEEGDSEEEDEEDDALASRAAPTAEEVVRLPSSRDDAVVRGRLEQAKRRHLQSGEEEDTGVVYIGRLPHGFFEEQLKAYFTQFGDVRRVRISRNKKTGHSKHYGFIEFDSREVAEIVVETMNNYLLDGHLIQMALIPKDEVDPNLWVGANRKFRKVPTDRVERVRRSRPRTDEERARVNKRLLQREAKRRAKLARAGIEYDFPGYQQ